MMSWSSGSILMDCIIDSAKRHIKDKQCRIKFYEEIITTFEDADCDNLYECEGKDKAFDIALKNIVPDKKEGWEIGNY